MRRETEKPTAEAKALSLFLMAHKTSSPTYKDQARRMNRLWDMVQINKLERSEYANEVQKMLDSYGGYSEVIEKTVRFYLKKSGEWKLKGDDKYCQDAQAIVDKISKE